MKKKMLSAFLCAAMAVTLVAGCGAPAADAGKDKGGDSKKEASEGIPKDEIKVGFVHISDPSDMGYTYNHDLGTKEMQKELGLSDDQIINKYNVPEDAECDTALRELVEAGCNIIFATSFGFEDYVKEVAAEYPDIQFCHATGFQASDSGLDNFHNYFASIYEGRYLAGIAAGLKTETNKLGYVAAHPFAEVISGYTAFYLGAKSVNPDVVGWIYIEALDNINYPVVQGDDNETYLHTTYENNYNFAGTIFVDYENSSDFSDCNTLIYGHNMKNGSMFGNLKKFTEDQSTYEKSKYFWILTPEKNYRYEIISAYTTGVNSDTYTLFKGPGEEYLNYLNTIQGYSEIKTEATELTVKDKIVTLSTCTGNEATRFVVQGKQVNAEPAG